MVDHERIRREGGLKSDGMYKYIKRRRKRKSKVE
jgi:hypothetical protein